MGLPFMPVRGLIGTDYLRIRPDFKVIRNPYGEDELVAIPAIRPRLALIHGFRADRYGNVLTDKRESDPLLARAAERTVASVEEIVSEVVPERDRVVIPGIYVDAVVHLPGGAGPTACPGYYDVDDGEIQRYLSAARSPETFRQYLAEFVARREVAGNA
ncbi:MAG: hypothetical protein H5T97_07440 [Firmicutes bacterium]|nr:hypothetical protein [Bacillota bacterium]